MNVSDFSPNKLWLRFTTKRGSEMLTNLALKKFFSANRMRSGPRDLLLRRKVVKAYLTPTEVQQSPHTSHLLV